MGDDVPRAIAAASIADEDGANSVPTRTACPMGEVRAVTAGLIVRLGPSAKLVRPQARGPRATVSLSS
jgi:hypothetical protein